MEVKAHPLTATPDKCYIEEERNGRYKNLREGVNEIDTQKKANSIRFVCISDTHNKTDELHELLPHGDVLIHAGDFTAATAKHEITHFNDFLGKIKNKYKHIVVIAGNHDLSFDKMSWNKGGFTLQMLRGYSGKEPAESEKLRPNQAKALLTNCTYIEDETIELFGIKIFGSPWQPEFCDLGFNANRGEPILSKWNKIPNDTDILVTHGPPLGIGDRVVRGKRVGCAELLATIMDRVRPRYHIYGHIHEDYGIRDDGMTTFINASTMNRQYKPNNRAVVFDYEHTVTTGNSC